ncbi:glycosyltransferase family 39 protein, partial [Candidatus Woesearchaeota archaeon]|nr:glycosyltransferase family 39 protein [Candidatus Woesearchaeota archaeon]
MNLKSTDKYVKLAIAVIIIGIIARFAMGMVYHPSGDACRHLSVGKFIAANGKVPLVTDFGMNEFFWSPPLFHFITAFVSGFFSIFNEDIGMFGMKFVSPLFGSLTLVFSYLTFRKLFGKKISFYAILFLAFIPIHMDYSVFGYVESTLVFFVVLSVYFALENRPLLSSLAAGLSILAKYNGIFIIPLLFYIFYYKN